LEERTAPTFIHEDGDSMFSETLVSTYKSTRCPNPEKHHHQPHHCENLKSHIIFIVHDSYNFCFFQGQGVEEVDISLEDQTVLVTSTLSADQLLETIKKTGKTTSYVGVKH
jgi:hypothetical protein